MKPVHKLFPIQRVYQQQQLPFLLPLANGMLKTMANVEELPPHPFLKYLDYMGLPTFIREQQEEKKL